VTARSRPQRVRQTMTLCIAALAAALSAIVARADDDGLTILSNQPYALCAGAIAFVFDQVAYANCQLLFGNSISATRAYPAVPLTNQPAGNIETVNQIGIAWSDFIVSTYSPSAGATSPQGNQAIYTCRPGSTGSYAQCDGGLCFNNTTGTTFPGLGTISNGQIVCSCPITNPVSTRRTGYEFVGPYRNRQGL
jgi:hypothetical protein